MKGEQGARWVLSSFLDGVFHFEEGATVLEQVVTDGARPDDADNEKRRLPVAGGGDAETHLLTEETFRPYQADTGRRQITAQQGEGSTVLGLHLDGLDEVESILAATLDAGGGFAIGTNEPAHTLADLILLRARNGAGGWIVIAAGAIIQGGFDGGDYVLPQCFG